MNFEIITTTEQLRLRCESARQHSVVMLDTEFVRTRTLYPRLGLIQMFDGEHLSLVDPLGVEDMTPLWDLLRDQSVIKVLHACGEDLEVFQHYAGCLPVPMLDTQIMAAFLGHGISTGFGSLVKEYVGVELDKGESRTNWLARPLTDNQLDYAAADVYYLKPLFEILLAKVEAAGYMEALQQECNTIMLRRTKILDPNKAYLDIKNAWQLNPKQLAVLQQLAAWRVREARKRDIALNFIVKELHLWKLARLDIKSRTVMEKEGFEPMEIQRHGNRLLKMVHDCDAINSVDYPKKIERLVDFAGYKQMVQCLKNVVTEVEVTTGLAPEFLASKKQIHQLLSWAWKYQRADEKRPEMLKNWRQVLFETRILSILDEK